MKKDEKHRKGRKKKVCRRFDPVLKNIFVSSMGAILRIIGISSQEARKIKVLPTEIRITKTLRLDILTEIPSFIVHFEIQNFTDPHLPRRMFLYYVSIDLWQEREVEQGRRKEDEIKPILQVVIWLGEGEPPPAEYRTPTTVHRYHVVDMRKVSPEVFLRSDNPYEVILALLAGRFVARKGRGHARGKEQAEEVLHKVIRRLQELAKTEKELLKYIEEIEILGSLFGLGVEVKDMIKGEIDITKTSLFREGERIGFLRGREIGLREGEKKGEKRGEKRGEKKGERIGRIDELRKAILVAVHVRFGRGKLKVVEKKIGVIDDIKKLRAIYMKTLKSQNWKEFSGFLNSKNGKSLSLNSKNKKQKKAS